MMRRMWQSFQLPLALMLLVGFGVRAEFEDKVNPRDSVIAGVALADSSGCIVTVSNSENSFSTKTDGNGFFSMKAVPAGTYSVSIEPISGMLKGITLRDVSVADGQRTELGTIELFCSERPSYPAGNFLRSQS